MRKRYERWSAESLQGFGGKARVGQAILWLAILGGCGLLRPATQAQEPQDPQEKKTNGVGLPILGRRPPDVAPVEGQPLEHRPPNGLGQKPAFAEQTRAPAVITKTPYKETVVAQGLNKPWGLAFLPGGKVLISEKPGGMVIVNTRTGRVEHKLAGVPAVKYLGDGGMLDVVADPHFAENRRIYFTYVEPRGPIYQEPQLPLPEQDNGVVIARAQVSADNTRLQKVTTLIRVGPSVPQSAHYGSRLVFDRDGYLFVSLGERFFYPTRGEAQSLFSYMGKILRIDTDGKPAPGNPFDQGRTAENFTLPEIWSIGQRNPEGLAIEPATGELWDSEHGPQGGDEINHIERGKNYGWPLISYGVDYDGTKVDERLTCEDGIRADCAHLPPNGSPGRTQAPGLEQPVYYWDPVIAPSGMTFYDGQLMPEWRGNLFVAGLAGQHVSRLVMRDGKVVGEERLLLDQHQRMRAVKEGPDGALWVVTDEEKGRLIRVAPR